MARIHPWCLQGFNHISWDKAACRSCTLRSVTGSPEGLPWLAYNRFTFLGPCCVSLRTHVMLFTCLCALPLPLFSRWHSPRCHTAREAGCTYNTDFDLLCSTLMRVFTWGDTCFLNSLCPPSLLGTIILFTTAGCYGSDYIVTTLYLQVENLLSAGTRAGFCIHLKTW